MDSGSISEIEKQKSIQEIEKQKSIQEIEKQKSIQEIEKQKSIQEIERIDSEIDKEVKDEQYDDFKTKIEILVQVGKDELRSCTLTDCYTTDRPGLHLEILPKVIFEAVDGETSVEEIDVQKPIFRQTVDQGTQASIEYKSSKAQTLRRRMVNSWSQYEPRLFTEQDIESHLNQPSFQIFRENTEESILESLVQNSIADSFFWDLTSLYDEETTTEDEEKHLILLLEYFDDISVIKFNPVKPNLLAAGSLSGQLVLWDVKPDTYMTESDDNDKFNSLAGFTTPPVARCIAIGSMDHMHKYGITDLLWVPPNVEISFRGDIVKDAPGGFQIITSGLDGQIQVLPPEGKKSLSLTCFVLRETHESINNENENKPYPTSEFYAGCDDGKLLCGSFKLVRDDAGKYVVQQPEYFKSSLGGAITVLACSPFINDVLLSTGGKTIAIWKHNIKKSLDISSNICTWRVRNAYITSGQWSPTKPALFLLGLQDGSIEIWDLACNLYEPCASSFISTSAIKSVSIQSLNENEHIVAAGDSKGIVYTMNLLPRFWTPGENELQKICQLIETETNRILKQTAASPVALETPKKQIEKKPSKKIQLEDDAKTEETAMDDNFKEFLKLQKTELIAMGLLEEETASEEEIE
ncbi:WD repeat-containing protein 63 [Trichonephila inaurata madagascariensis]|uniref:WD repeat-containing protein 63 n=1 Tax=Trichonephila inaurata madagascariensis TaxID=2747483 RepID=A0A8X6J5C8_9ARAC|nr:WD repeat-containing protein 63 [Trichonephila inaurata madagascariensis]